MGRGRVNRMRKSTLELNLFYLFLLLCLTWHCKGLDENNKELQESNKVVTNELQTLELAVISCLNGHGVNVNRHWNECKMKANYWKELKHD